MYQELGVFVRGRENRILGLEVGHGRKNLNAERKEVGGRERWGH